MDGANNRGSLCDAGITIFLCNNEACFDVYEDEPAKVIEERRVAQNEQANFRKQRKSSLRKFGWESDSFRQGSHEAEGANGHSRSRYLSRPMHALLTLRSVGMSSYSRSSFKAKKG